MKPKEMVGSGYMDPVRFISIRMTKALRIQVPDPYFSPNGDGVKDTLAFNVIAETSEAYQVALKRNGIAVKTWAGLTGSQSLSWDGLQNGQALADGRYRIVAMTEKQRDRVRDAQRRVLDTVGPVFSNSRMLPTFIMT